MRYTEKQMTSELLDQPPFTGAPKKLFICSTPRSGSYMLCRYMINAGLGVPHEYFNPIIMREMAPRLGLGDAIRGLQWQRRTWRDQLPFGNPARTAEEAFLQRYLAALVPLRCQAGIFAAKVHHEHLVKVLENPTGRALLDGGVFIYLYREDLLKQAVSAQFAHLTGRWGVDDTVTTTPSQKPDFFNIKLLDNLLIGLAEQDRAWRVFLSRNCPTRLTISYEQLCEDPYRFLSRIARHVGIDPASLRRNHGESRHFWPTDSGLPGKHDVARHYVHTVRTFCEAKPVTDVPLHAMPFERAAR